DHLVLVENWRRCRAPAGCSRADTLVPDLLAFEVEAIDARLAEKDEQVLAVAGRGAGGIAVLAVVARLVLRFRQHRLDILGPTNLTRFSIEADNVAHQVRLIAGILLRLGIAAVASQENGVANSDRARSSQAGQLRLPQHVFLFRPLLRQALFVAD